MKLRLPLMGMAPRLIVALWLLAVGLLPAPVAAAPLEQAAELSSTAIAFQQFQHGFMFWRADTGRIVVGYSDIRTKSGAACQELYRDTYRGQAYEIPPAPPGLSVPQLGFGWLYASDQQLAQRLGYATADEVSRLAEIGTTTDPGGNRALAVALGEEIPGVPNPLLLATSDEPGLTYCFARGNEDRSRLNTWVAIQLFEHGWMIWRQDRPERIDVGHDDTDLAPELGCLDVFGDPWRPGEELGYGDLAVPGKRLPERGFGKVWLDNAYVRQSLGYPTTAELGGFAVVSFERFNHPRRGDLLVRKTVLNLPDGSQVTEQATFPAGGDRQQENVLSQGCSKILIPHAPR